MTGDDDSASEAANKSGGDEQAFLELLKALGRPAPAPANLSLGDSIFMEPLSRLDLIQPRDEARALWIMDGLYSGKLIAYGQPANITEYQISAVPTADWPDLALNWSSGQAEQKTVTGRFEGLAWSELRIPVARLSDAPHTSLEHGTLPIVLADAAPLAQRWRERRLIPEGYPWLEAEFWKANPAQRPDQRETAAAVEAAIRGGELTALWEEDGEWCALPPSAWYASPDRADFARGRLNVGDVTGWPIPRAHGAHAALGLGRQETWRLVFLRLRELLDWCETSWGQRQPDLDASQGAEDSSPDTEATSNAAKPPHISRKGIGGRPRENEWDKFGAAFGAWLHDEPGRDRLTPEKYVKAVQKLAVRLGCEQPDRSTAQPYITRWLQAYRSFDADN